MAEAGIRHHFVPESHLFSGRNVLHGLHYHLRCPQGKGLRVAGGQVSSDPMYPALRCARSFPRLPPTRPTAPIPPLQRPPLTWSAPYHHTFGPPAVCHRPWRSCAHAPARGACGETYNTGGRKEKPNPDVVEAICAILDELRPDDPVLPRRNLITFVKDRPGHDWRYAIDAGNLEGQLGRRPRETFATAIRKTIEWYLANDNWVGEVSSGHYRRWMATQYSQS
jgi:hypothetical protein